MLAQPVVLSSRSSALRPVARARRAALVVRANWFNDGKKALARAQAGSYDRAATRAKIDALIAGNKVFVASWSGCPFCKSAKALLAEVGAEFTALELDTIPDGKALRAELAEMTDRTSVPNIWIAGKNVGGCNDGPGVATLHKQGELVPMLKAAGALK